MKLFKTNIGKEENTLEQIKQLAKEHFAINMPTPEYVFFWNDKDIDLYITHRNLLKAEKERDEVKAVVAGNKEYYGYFQEQFQKTRSELETAKLHLELEKKAYENLYMEKREVESKLYEISRGREE